MYRWRLTANDARTDPASAAEVRKCGLRIHVLSGLIRYRLNVKLQNILELRSSPRLAPMALAIYSFRGRHALVWSWKDEQLQQAWWTLVCCHCETMHARMHQSPRPTSTERRLGRAVGSAAISVSCLQRFCLGIWTKLTTENF